MNDLITPLKKLTAFAIAERDSFYDASSLEEGEVPHPDDRAELARIDAMINEAQAAIKSYEAWLELVEAQT